MAEIDDAINKLSPDELDLLNSDPKMLSDFKAKYSQPTSPSLGDYVTGAKMALSTLPQAQIPSEIGEYAQGIAQSAKEKLYDVPKAAISSVGQLAEGQSLGQTDLSKFATDKGVEALETGLKLKEALKHPVTSLIDYVTSHPLTTASLFMTPPEAGPETSTKGFAETLSDNANSKLARINKSLANVNENATKMGGMGLPVPTQEELNQGVKNLLDAHKKVIDEHGAMLNQAKEEAGLPVSVEDKTQSIRKYGNEFNLDLGKPLALPESMSKKAPLMEEDIVGATTKDLAKPEVEVYTKGMQSDGKGGQVPIYNVKGSPEEIAKLGYGTDPGSIPEDALKQHGLLPLGNIDKVETMPYSITPTESAKELNTEISRFMKNQKYISNADKVKAASFYQDKINNFVDWGKKQGDIEGMLKTQHAGLQDVISEASPKLQEAKTKWADLQKNLDLVNSHLDPKEPGATQAYLKRLFTSNSPAAQDSLKQLAYLEKLTKKPVVTNLFKQFAGQAFGPLVSRPGREMLEAAGGITSAMLGHPGGAVAAGGLLAAQSPKVLGAIESGIPKIMKRASSIASRAGVIDSIKGFTPGAINPQNNSELQSIRDRLNNAK